MAARISALPAALITTSLILMTNHSVAADDLDDRVKELEQKIEILTDTLENQSQSANNNKTSIGGYGELHYNSLDNSTDEIDFHRFVLFFGHELSDNIRFFSELELEHSLAGDGKPGEVELEQAYIEFDINQHTQAKAGLFLIPVGILNETHEPPTFYGVERNPVEKNIIPTTWWEGGTGLTGQFGEGFSYDVAIHSGLNVQGDPTDSKFLDIRSGRQKVAEATAENFAVTSRIKYTGIAGLELAATIQVQDDITQNDQDNVEGATLIETHAIYQGEYFGFRALYAMWDIDGTNLGSKDEQDGYYVEGSYKLNEKIGFFLRQDNWNNGSLIGSIDDSEQSNVGVNYWPHQNVVVKLDIQKQNSEAGDKDGFNLGIGYQF